MTTRDRSVTAKRDRVTRTGPLLGSSGRHRPREEGAGRPFRSSLPIVAAVVVGPSRSVIGSSIPALTPTQVIVLPHSPTAEPDLPSRTASMQPAEPPPRDLGAGRGGPAAPFAPGGTRPRAGLPRDRSACDPMRSDHRCRDPRGAVRAVAGHAGRPARHSRRGGRHAVASTAPAVRAPDRLPAGGRPRHQRARPAFCGPTSVRGRTRTWASARCPGGPGTDRGHAPGHRPTPAANTTRLGHTELIDSWAGTAVGARTSRRGHDERHHHPGCAGGRPPRASADLRRGVAVQRRRSRRAAGTPRVPAARSAAHRSRPDPSRGAARRRGRRVRQHERQGWRRPRTGRPVH